MKKQEFIKNALDNQVELENELFYKVLLVNQENFDMTDELLRQLMVEDLYGESFIGVIVSKETGKVSQQTLPIYGNSKKYVTKFFTKTKNEAIENDLRDKQMELLKRAI